MTTHIQAQALTDYLHGALAPAEDALAYAHFAECADCRAELELERSLTDLLRSAALSEEREFPSMIKAQVWQTIRDAKPTPLSRVAAWLRPVVALPIAAAILVGVLLAGPLRPSSSALPTIDATFYLDEHAAQLAPNPLSERNSFPQTIETAYDQSAGTIADVAAHEAMTATGSLDVVR